MGDSVEDDFLFFHGSTIAECGYTSSMIYYLTNFTEHINSNSFIQNMPVIGRLLITNNSM